MKILAASLTLCCTTLGAVEVLDGQIFLSPQERYILTICEHQGGCRIVTRTMVERVIEMSLEDLARAASAAITDAETSCRRKI